MEKRIQTTLNFRSSERELEKYLKSKYAEVREIGVNLAKNLIEPLEYLDSMGTPSFAFGLFHKEQLLGAVCFSQPPSSESAAAICGERFFDKVIFLQRGACLPQAPQNSSSYLIASSTQKLPELGYNLVIAYADERAGEIGTVYQADNWIYTGTTKEHLEYFMNGEWKDGREARSYYKRHNFPKPTVENYNTRRSPPKHRYIKIVGSKPMTEKLTRELNFEVKEYPKRTSLDREHKVAKLKKAN